VPHHGYKGHIGADLSGIVTRYGFGTAKQHDADHFDYLTEGEQHLVLADSMYSSKERRANLRARGIIDGICYQRRRGQEKLYHWQQRWNRVVARHRARVEHPTAMMKQQLGYRRVRYTGMQRNAFDFALILAACNLKRSLHLRAA
jgi:IS5 family transposase